MESARKIKYTFVVVVQLVPSEYRAGLQHGTPSYTLASIRMRGTPMGFFLALLLTGCCL